MGKNEMIARAIKINNEPTKKVSQQIFGSKAYCDPADTTLIVRFRLEGGKAVHDFSSKFGASQIDAVTLLRAAHDAGFAAGLTFHPGSQCFDPDAYAEHIAAAAQISLAAGVELGVAERQGLFTKLFSEDPFVEDK